MVGQGQSLGSSDDVCIIFYPSPFCKPFFPLHPLTWHPPPSLLCTMDMEDAPYVTIQTHPSGPKALVLQILGPGGSGTGGGLGRRSLCPPPRAAGACWTLTSAKPIQTSCGDATIGFRGFRIV